MIPSDGETLNQLTSRLKACKGGERFSKAVWMDQLNRNREGFIQTDQLNAFTMCVSSPSRSDQKIPNRPICISGGSSGEKQTVITDPGVNRFIDQANAGANDDPL